MENQEQKPTSSSGAEEKKNEHPRRNRRNGKQHPPRRKDKAPRSNGGDEEHSKQPQAAPSAAKKQNNAQGNKKKRAHANNHPNRNRDGHSHGGAKFVSASSVGLYEDAEKEARELAELRAKIVLSSAPVATEASDTKSPEAVTDSEPTLPTSAQPAEEKEQVEVVSVRFRSSSKTYYFESRGIVAKPGDYAILETARGPEFGEVCHGNSMVSVSETVSPLRPLLRLATKEDIAHNEENRKREREALGICQEKIRKHGLEMKLIDVQYAFDNSKLLFYFTAEGRVDFRDLVKDLASVFHTRIELRQIGIRDETKMLGGIGACGRALCCSTFLPDFAQVSIKMAKEQGLSLNSAKISGVCGRLMCCLRYEADVYAEEIKRSPAVDSSVKTEDGIGRVISVNPLAGTVRVLFQNAQDTSVKQYHRNEVSVIEKERKAPAEKQEKKAVRENNEEK